MSHRPRVIIVGGGMVGARCAEELRSRSRPLEIIVLGDEEHLAYNRVLLSTALAGSLAPSETELHPERWWRERDIDFRTSTSVQAVDAAARTVLVDGPAGPEQLPFDHLVFATGARSYLPPTLTTAHDVGHPEILGLRGRADCERVLAAARGARNIAVIGGGVLGVEIADALARNPDVVGRGARVSLLHPGDAPMDKQLGATPGAILARCVREQGVDLILGARAGGVEEGGLRLGDGQFVPADLVVVSAGVRANTALAENAGVDVRRGIVIDERCSTSADGLWAAGDCAEFDGVPTGTLRPGWEQAEVVAHNICAQFGGAQEPRTVAHRREAVRLKIDALDVASFGRWCAEPFDWEPGGPDVTVLSDPAAGRYGKLVVESGRIVGGVLVGMDDVVGAVTQMFDSGAMAPLDRLAMLTGTESAGAGGGEPEPADMPGEHTVCQCNAVSKDALVRAHGSGACDVAAIAECTRATTGCGTCTGKVEKILGWLDAQDAHAREPATV